MTTQFATACYEEVIDLHTESDKVSVVGLHTPNSDTPVNMLSGFWNQFRKVKYNGCSITMVPAARLPADPLQVSYDAGEPTIDPRDMLNPILFHGCHGNDMGAILNDLYNSADANSFVTMPNQSDSADLNVFPQSIVPGDGGVGVYEALYYKAMTDKTWLKAHPQKGFRKSGLHPMVYSLASTVQFGGLTDGPFGPTGVKHSSLDGTESMTNTGTAGLGGSNVFSGSFTFGRPHVDLSTGTVTAGVDRSAIGLMTPRLQKLGWLDTRQVSGVITSGTVESNSIPALYQTEELASRKTTIPKIFMGMIMLPPAYKTEQYFRLVINHSFSFAKFRGASMQNSNAGMTKHAFNVYNFNEADNRKIDPKKGDTDGSDESDDSKL